MLRQRRLVILVTILTCFLQAQGADKYTDENRPYEFGFNIEGEQHRHEKKDEKGLIMGEFGFITADGVYHVTVYATDENGNFRILSMKNIRVKPYPNTSERQGHSLSIPSGQQGPPTVPNRSSIPGPVEPAPVKSCSHCSIPTTTTIRPALTNSLSGNPNYPQTNNYGNSNNYPGPNNGGNNPNYPGSNFGDSNYPRTDIGNNPNYPQPGIDAQYPGQQPSGERTPKQFDSYPQRPDQSRPSKPILDSAQISIVDRNTDIYKKAPGEQDGLPNGLTKDDMMTLLYTFNYTVGFHGHFEEGYTNGAKQGYYFVTGRNGVRTRVDYVADEKGFRPKISQEVLDLLSEDVPKPETEKDEKYGLKGYEFKWLYYPVESKGR